MFPLIRAGLLACGVLLLNATANRINTNVFFVFFDTIDVYFSLTALIALIALAGGGAGP